MERLLCSWLPNGCIDWLLIGAISMAVVLYIVVMTLFYGDDEDPPPPLC